MSKEHKDVSAVVLNFNDVKIVETIRSIDNQTIKPKEIIIIDDCSDIYLDEKPPANIFTKRNISISKFDKTIDLYLLANCNLVVGPPSSFSSWAVFYGNSKRVCVLDENQTLTVNIP